MVLAVLSEKTGLSENQACPVSGGIQRQLCTFRDPPALLDETLGEQPNRPEVTLTIPYTGIVYFHGFSYFFLIYFGGI